MRRPKKTVTINLSDYLSAGTYNVKVKSKGTDIRDSADSNNVECVVAASGYQVQLICHGFGRNCYIKKDGVASSTNYDLSNNDFVYDASTTSWSATLTGVNSYITIVNARNDSVGINSATNATISNNNTSLVTITFAGNSTVDFEVYD